MASIIQERRNGEKMIDEKRLKLSDFIPDLADLWSTFVKAQLLELKKAEERLAPIRRGVMKRNLALVAKARTAEVDVPRALFFEEAMNMAIESLLSDPDVPDEWKDRVPNMIRNASAILSLMTRRVDDDLRR